MVKSALLVLSLLVCACASQSTPHLHAHQVSEHPKDDWYGIDKLAHFSVSAAIAAGVTNYKERHGSSGCAAARMGFAITLSIGAGKELYDKKIKKTFWSWEDMTWDAIGATVGSLAAADC